MKKFFRENPTLVFGLGLPLLIVAVFTLAAILPDLGAIPPRYDILYAVNYYPNNRGINIHIDHGKAKVAYVGDCNYGNIPKLFLYSAAKGSVHEIPLSLPPRTTFLKPCYTGKDTDTITTISVPELDALNIDNSSIAPDGYEFAGAESYYSHDLLGGFFFSGGYRNGAVLKKGPHKIHMPQTENYYGNYQFIGWVVPK